MPRPSKRKVLQALGNPHLRAIGSVAAHWNALEMALLWAVSECAGLRLDRTLALVGSQNAKAWCEMLLKLTGEVRLDKSKPLTVLEKIVVEIDALRGERNKIVHADWNPRRPIILSAINPDTPPLPAPRSKEKASGFGIKRGTALLSDISYSAPEMLTIAGRIETVQGRLYVWLSRWQRKQQATGALATLWQSPIPANSSTAPASPPLGLLSEGLFALGDRAKK